MVFVSHDKIMYISDIVWIGSYCMFPCIQGTYLVNALVFSPLDNCNMLVVGVIKSKHDKTQKSSEL